MQIEQLCTLAADTRNSVKDIRTTLGVSGATYYRYLKAS
jgi:hypothetical protein